MLLLETTQQIGIFTEDNPVKKSSPEAEKIMIERFGKDTVIALAAAENELPYVRYVNAYYENGILFIRDAR